MGWWCYWCQPQNSINSHKGQDRTIEAAGPLLKLLVPDCLSVRPNRYFAFIVFFVASCSSSESGAGACTCTDLAHIWVWLQVKKKKTSSMFQGVWIPTWRCCRLVLWKCLIMRLRNALCCISRWYPGSQLRSWVHLPWPCWSMLTHAVPCCTMLYHAAMNCWTSVKVAVNSDTEDAWHCNLRHSSDDAWATLHSLQHNDSHRI